MKTVLIADDSLYSYKALKLFLEHHNYSVIGWGDDGNVVLSLYKEMHPDLVTLDITMPNKDGYQALTEILEYDPKAKIVMISAVVDKNVIAKCLESGAKFYYKKPLRLNNSTAADLFLHDLKSLWENEERSTPPVTIT